MMSNVDPTKTLTVTQLLENGKQQVLENGKQIPVSYEKTAGLPLYCHLKKTLRNSFPHKGTLFSYVEIIATKSYGRHHNLVDHCKTTFF
jgi:hypothetical protein